MEPCSRGIGSILSGSLKEEGKNGPSRESGECRKLRSGVLGQAPETGFQHFKEEYRTSQLFTDYEEVK